MNPLASTKCARRVLMALAAISGIFLTTGCGSNGTSVIVKGGFTKSSLKGTYSFAVKGYGFNAGTLSAANFFIEGGVLTSDGNGNITAGTDDFVEAVGNTTQAFSDSVTGTYIINPDGTGDLTLNFASGGQEVYRITLSDAGDLYMQEEDGGGTSAGSAQLQTSSTTPAGTFVFRTHDVQVSSTIGAMTITAGAVSGSYLMVQNGVAATGSIGAGGSMTAPTGGRGTITYSVNGTTHTADYYVVSPSKFLLFDITPGILSIGSAEQQSNVAFVPSSLTGSFTFGSSGETATPGFVNTVG